jgi:hypothetical protein
MPLPEFNLPLVPAISRTSSLYNRKFRTERWRQRKFAYDTPAPSSISVAASVCCCYGPWHQRRPNYHITQHGNDINPCEPGEVAIWHHFRLSDWTTFHLFRFYSWCAGNTIPRLNRIYEFILPTLCNTEQLSVLGLFHISDCIRHIKAILAEKGLF